jgi:hypothetical protein
VKWVEDEVNINLFLLPVDDIVCTKLNIWKKHLGRVWVAVVIIFVNGEIAISRKVVGNTECLHV